MFLVNYLPYIKSLHITVLPHKPYTILLHYLSPYMLVYVQYIIDHFVYSFYYCSVLYTSKERYNIILRVRTACVLDWCTMCDYVIGRNTYNTMSIPQYNGVSCNIRLLVTVLCMHVRLPLRY